MKKKFSVLVSVLICGISSQLLCRCAGPAGLSLCGQVLYGGKVIEGGLSVRTNTVSLSVLFQKGTNSCAAAFQFAL